MLDQAAKLRTLVLRSARAAAAELGAAPKLVAITGSQKGVGATTLALNLAVAAARQAARVVLVDLDTNLADVVSGRRDIHEILELGPGGIQVARGARGASSSIDYTEESQERLIRQLKTLGRHADLVLLDTGSTSGKALQRFWRPTDEIVIVTTPEQLAVLDAYAAIKTCLPAESPVPLALVVNREANPAIATDVYLRLSQSCRRFLAREVRYLGSVAQLAISQLAVEEAFAGVDRMAELLLEDETHGPTQPKSTAA